MQIRLVGSLILWLVPGFAASAAAQAASAGLPVVMLSDIHFDPLHDPAKVARLAAAPVEEWEKILAEPNSPTQKAQYDAMQTECTARGNDPGNALLNSVLKAAKLTPGVKFVTVTGDLLAHDFGCRYHAMTHGKAAPGTGTAIMRKSVNYVARRVEAAFPNVPVYFALGNNDSSCGDYRLSLKDPFLAATSESVLHGLRGADPAELKAAGETYDAGGYYAVTLGAGMDKTRLISINDVFQSSLYSTCPGAAPESAAAEELKWLDAELGDAEQKGEKVWIIGHIPPGPDAFNTLKHLRSMCSRPATMFLSSDALADTLKKHEGVIRLAVFAHTHLDEMKVLEKDGDKAGGVAIKIVPSVSEINGNVPAFTVAKVDAGSATLEDYTVYTLPGGEAGGKWSWQKEYDFRTTYHQQEFTARTVRAMSEAFQDDKAGTREESLAYMKYFYPGEGSPLFLVWAPYSCGFTRDKEADFKACFCGK